MTPSKTSQLLWLLGGSCDHAKNTLPLLSTLLEVPTAATDGIVYVDPIRQTHNLSDCAWTTSAFLIMRKGQFGFSYYVRGPYLL